MTIKLFWVMTSCLIIIGKSIGLVRQMKQAYKESNYKWFINCLTNILFNILICTFIYLAL